MIRGDTRHSSGRESNFGRRLRVGALGTIAIGGAIVMGGAASLVTALANTGSVTGSQSCTTWSASVTLDGNVTPDKNIDVVSTLKDASGTLVGPPSFADATYDTNSTGKSQTIWTASGAAPVSGTLSLEIDYSNDTSAEHLPSESGYSVTLAPPSDCTSAIKTTPSAGGVVGTAVHDSATVTGSLGSPSGTVIFKLFSPSNATCNSDGDAAVFTSSPVSLTSVTPGTSTASSPDFTTTAIGTYHWVASYSGDSTYNGATSQCADEAVTTTQGGPSIATVAGAGGQVPIDVSDSATVSGGVNPTGTVTFTLYPSMADCNAGTNAVGTASTVALSGGKATSAAVNVTTAGTYQWIAKYSGDANNASASSACGDEPVTTTSGGGGLQGITTPGTGSNGSLTGITIGGFLLLGGLAVGLVGSILPRRRRSIQ